MHLIHGYRRRLPHLRAHGKTYFVTFRAAHRQNLPPRARTIALDAFVFEHSKTCWLHSLVVMPDHAHLVVTPYPDWALERILERAKRVSSHHAKRELGLREVWERESFDHMLRSTESAEQKSEYIRMNPVRAGLVTSPDDWPWFWSPSK